MLLVLGLITDIVILSTDTDILSKEWYFTMEQKNIVF